MSERQVTLENTWRDNEQPSKQHDKMPMHMGALFPINFKLGSCWNSYLLLRSHHWWGWSVSFRTDRTCKTFMLLEVSSSLNAGTSRGHHDERYVVEISIHKRGVLEPSTRTRCMFPFRWSVDMSWWMGNVGYQYGSRASRKKKNSTVQISRLALH